MMTIKTFLTMKKKSKTNMILNTIEVNKKKLRKNIKKKKKWT